MHVTPAGASMGVDTIEAECDVRGQWYCRSRHAASEAWDEHGTGIPLPKRTVFRS